MVHEAIRELLLSDPNVAGWVEERIYVPPVSVSGSQPFVIYQVVSNPVVQSQGGYSGLDETHVQIDCYAADLLTAKQLAGAVFAALRTVRDRTVGGCRIQGIEFEDRGRDDYEREVRLHIVRLECTVWNGAV